MLLNTFLKKELWKYFTMFQNMDQILDNIEYDSEKKDSKFCFIIQDNTNL